MLAAEAGELAAGEHALAGGDGQEAVLGTEERVLLAEPQPLGLDVVAVVRAALGDGLPVEGEVAAEAVAAFQLEALLGENLQQGGAVPRGAVEDGSGVARGAHGAELLEELLGVDVLGLVDLQQQVGGCTNDVGGGIGAEEGLPGALNAGGRCRPRGASSRPCRRRPRGRADGGGSRAPGG